MGPEGSHINLAIPFFVSVLVFLVPFFFCFGLVNKTTPTKHKKKNSFPGFGDTLGESFGQRKPPPKKN